MAEITCLSHIVIRSMKLDEWADYGVNILGMEVAERSAERLCLRMDDRAYRLIIEQGPEEDLASAGWELDNQAELEAFVTHLRAQGINVGEAGEDLRRSRNVERLYLCDDPNGFVHEFGAGYKRLCQPFRSKVLVSAFRTGELGLGHFVPLTKDVETSEHFYENVLKLGVSGYMRPNDDLKIVFFHSRTGRFHTLATANLPMPKKIFHIGIEVMSLDDVGRALDRAQQAGITITASIGHHPNAKSVSFYMDGPSGFQFEILWNEIIIDREHWQVMTYQETSDWGHAAPG